MSGFSPSQLRAGHCENDAERTILRWLLDKNTTYNDVEKCSGIRASFIREWVKSLSPSLHRALKDKT